MARTQLGDFWLECVVTGFGAIAFLTTPAVAQIIPDGTLGEERSVVTPNVTVRGALGDRIDGGATRGINLFHSFQELNVAQGQRVYFANPVGVENILSRVTGSDVSDILGTIGVDGAANLFLLNPNGIIFGPNAQLDVRGAFLATTANSFIFADTSEFSAINPQEPSLLAINVPVGLQYGGRQAGAIASLARLAVAPGQSLVLSGGPLNLIGSQLTAPGGRVELGAVAGAGVVGLSADRTTLDLSFPNNLGRADISLNNRARIDASGDRGGGIQLYGGQITFDNASAFSNTLGVEDGEAIIIQASELNLINSATVQTLTTQIGNGGDIIIETETLNAEDRGGLIAGSLLSQGNTGNVSIRASEAVNLTNTSLGTLSVGTGTGLGTGSAGDVFIETKTLNLQNSGLSVNTFLGQGNAGNITIRATDSVNLSLASSVSASSFGTGLGGNISIDTGNLVLQTGSAISTDTFNPTVVNLNEIVESLSFDDPAFREVFTVFLNYLLETIEPGSFRQGNSGNISIRAIDRIELNGSSADGLYSRLTTRTSAAGAAGDITLDARELSVRNGAFISTATSGEGTGGDLTVLARDAVEIVGTSPDGQDISILNTGTSSSGDAGDLSITTRSLSVRDGAGVTTSTTGAGQGGDLTVGATEFIELGGFSALADGRIFRSFVSTATQGTGAAGNLTFDTGRLRVQDGALVSAATSGLGRGGNLSVTARDAVEVSGVARSFGVSRFGSLLSTETAGSNNAGNLSLTTQRLDVYGGGLILASTTSNGRGGNVTITADTINVADIADGQIRSGIASETRGSGASGNAGDVNISSRLLNIQDGAVISTATFNAGHAGDLQVVVSDSTALVGTGLLNGQELRSVLSSETQGDGDAGTLTLNTGRLSIRNGAAISAATLGAGDAGELRVNATESIELSGASANQVRSSINATVEGGASGQGGNLIIEAPALSVRGGASISVSTSGQGDAGILRVNAADIDLIGTTQDGERRSNLSATVAEEATGQGGDLIIQTQRLSVRDGAGISASTFGSGDAGLLRINANEFTNIVGRSTNGALPSELSVNVGLNSTGDGGNLVLRTGRLQLAERAQISASTSGQGRAGNITIRDANSVSLNRHSTISTAVNQNAIGQGGDITIQTRSLELNQSRITARTQGQGDAGDITVNANTIQARNGGQFLTSTSSGSNAGNIRFNIRGELRLEGDRTGLFANTAPNSIGNGGSIFIDPQAVILRDEARIAVDSQGRGEGGNIQIQAGDLTLDNRALISAETASNTGGDIELQVDDMLLLRDRSTISTTAGNNQAGGDGGNISIGANFIVAVPAENSDITANAFAGRGGSIDITTQGIYGIEFREQLTPLSDITATSTFGINGEVIITTPGIDPSRGLAELPVELTDASQQIAQSCPTGEATANDLGEFVVTGRGGLPPSPTELMGGETVVTQLATLGDEEADMTSQESNSTLNSQSTSPSSIVEAQGWITDAHGKVMLVAETANAAPYPLAAMTGNCNE